MAKLIIRDGTSQHQRLLPALKEGYFHVDEMRFSDLLALLSKHAELLRYFNHSNSEEGSWKPFFEADEIVVISEILSFNLKKVEFAFLQTVQSEEEIQALFREGSQGLEELPSLMLARAINRWLRILSGLTSVAALRVREKIEALIEKTLGYELESLAAFSENSGIRHATSVGLVGFEPAWQQRGSTDERSAASLDDRNSAEQFLTKNYYAFHNAVAFLQEHMADLLRLSLERENHDPSMGLLLAFLQLYAKAQQRINRFTQQHLRFYYEQVLKVPRHGSTPDSTHLLFTTDVAGREVLVKRGAAFLAGSDEQNGELIYEAQDDLLVTDARVEALHTLFFERDPLISPENALGLAQKQFATAAKFNSIPVGKSASDNAVAYPLFGEPRREGKALLLQNASLGFAIASKVLLLKQGRREITLTLHLAAAQPDRGLEAFVCRLGEILDNTTEADAFFKAFRHMFVISLTSETGWLKVEEYLPLCHIVDDQCEKNSLKIEITLPDNAPAIVPYSAAIHGGSFVTDSPIIRFEINSDAYFYPYSLLSETVVREIEIEVEVVGSSDVAVGNQLGPLSAAAQFAPFGPIPATGDYLVVGCYEAAQKKIVAFDVDVEWGGLPPQAKSFGDYYCSYPVSLNTASFKARLAVLRDRKWLPEGQGQRIQSLFCAEWAGTANDEQRISNRQRFSFAGLCELQRPIENIPEELYTYAPATKNGFVRLTLEEPACAFGHRDYPFVLSQVMTDNAKLNSSVITKFVVGTKVPTPLPNPPYTPLVNFISVNYRAISTLSLAQVASTDEGKVSDKMFHLHPLGVKSLSPKEGAITLLPREEAEGNLLIGIAASKLEGMLTLFFHLSNDSVQRAGSSPITANWDYLASDSWKRLPKRRVVSDTTDGFLTSGIVVLDLPAELNRDNTILPSELFWLRLSANGPELDALCSLYGIYTQALKVIWKRQEKNTSAHVTRLPAGTIKDAKVSMPGIAGIFQITDSCGGVPPESDEQWIVRTSERLKHKNRAITPWDYERLVLQRFPQIYKAKCFSCTSGDEAHADEVEPGDLLIVLIPHPSEALSLNWRPMVNALLLRQVHEFVSNLSSVHARVHVRNPAYEAIQVRCKVRFKTSDGHGRYVSQLNKAIFDYLSPWTPGGGEMKFGWSIRCNDVQSHIQKLDYVDAVSGLSLLYVSETGHESYRLKDTARIESGEITPAYPWSIAVPFANHLIESMDEKGVWRPAPTGIGDLGIGRTFIISKANA